MPGCYHDGVQALVLAALLTLADPVGDVPPPGYAWPQAAPYHQVGYADLVGFRVLERDGALWIGFRLDRTPNPGGAPLGFSLAVLADYLDAGPGGVDRLPGAGFRVPEGQEPEVAVVVSGWGAFRRRLDPPGERVALSATREGAWILVNTGLPWGRYRHYPAVGLYDPFDPWGFRGGSPTGGLWELRAPPGSPAAVDVLDAGAFARGVLEPARFARFPEPRMLLAFALALAAGVFVAWGAVGGLRRAREARAAR